MIFECIDYINDSYWPVKSFFNGAYKGKRFLWALESIAKQYGCGINEDYCSFPDPEDASTFDAFEGLRFDVWDEYKIITEDEAIDYISEACLKYLAIHPQDRTIVLNTLLDAKTDFAHLIMLKIERS